MHIFSTNDKVHIIHAQQLHDRLHVKRKVLCSCITELVNDFTNNQIPIWGVCVGGGGHLAAHNFLQSRMAKSFFFNQVLMKYT